MRRALVAVFFGLFLATSPFVAMASAPINWNDPKAAEAEINRRATEALKPFQAQAEQQQREAERWRALIQQSATASPNAPLPALPPSLAPALAGNQAAGGAGSSTGGGIEFSCQPSGCSGELCVPALAGNPMIGAGTCEFMSFYECYKGATCAKGMDVTGKVETCRWQDTAQLRSCLQTKGGQTALLHAGLIAPSMPK